jgi:hypothetical protein
MVLVSCSELAAKQKGSIRFLMMEAGNRLADSRAPKTCWVGADFLKGRGVVIRHRTIKVLRGQSAFDTF